MEMNCVSSIQYLGVEIDSELDWKRHIDGVCRKYLAKLSAIRRASAYLPSHVRKMHYQAFVIPHLDYCSVVWHSCGATLTQKIERVQNYALRMILNKPHRTGSEPLKQNWV